MSRSRSLLILLLLKLFLLTSMVLVHSFHPPCLKYNKSSSRKISERRHITAVTDDQSWGVIGSMETKKFQTVIGMNRPKIKSSLSLSSSMSFAATNGDDDESNKKNTILNDRNKDVSEGPKPGMESQAIEKKDDDKQKKNLSMPWSDIQEWALRDNLPKYTVMIPLIGTAISGGGEGHKKEGENDNERTNVYVLWRTMLKEVPEIAGYPIDFLQERQMGQVKQMKSESAGATSETIQVASTVLPYLEDYEFTSAGGVSGKVYGVPGLADGTRIETSPVSSVEVTLPKGFIRTSDGLVAYELGRPMREEYSTVSSTVADTVQSNSSKLLKSVKNVDVGSVVPQTTEDADGMLLRLGASTGILLAGATAINLLSHHLTVNVFWV